ncbi:hypothetical protein [Enterococcus mundtii]|uniref:hypothetical protein n=1 Tax=Enterococcus mundtii TaxID=53346 RepID=UPI001A95C7AC|nr:hypothetical protein [Enterococcus mundtii]MBO1087209.1 hypothetical protein [Enterococcus mundtii]
MMICVPSADIIIVRAVGAIAYIARRKFLKIKKKFRLVKWNLSGWKDFNRIKFSLIIHMIKTKGMKYVSFLLAGRCFSCGEYSQTIKVRNQNTSYTDELSNYTHECLNCHLEHESYWEERWKEYYSGLI